MEKHPLHITWGLAAHNERARQQALIYQREMNMLNNLGGMAASICRYCGRRHASESTQCKGCGAPR